MIGFTFQRILQSILVMAVVAFVAFSLFRFVGDPINNMVGQDTTQAQREQIRQELGLNDPFPVQYARFIKNAVRGNFGVSYRQRTPVRRLIISRMPATLELSFASVLIALFLGVPMGVYTALKRRGLLSQSFMTTSLIGISVPTFLTGILMIFVFGVLLRWLPTYGRGQVVQFGWWTSGLFTKSGWLSLIMPAFTLALFQMTLIMRLVRAEMLDVLQTDFIKFARARGLPERLINFRHALKNTLVPVITITGLQLGAIIAFSIVTETVFQWPGMGLLFIQSIMDVDIPVMAAYLLMIGFFFVIINLIVDLLYFAVDPRLRIQRAS